MKKQPQNPESNPVVDRIALQDYQFQLMLLEIQNKKRLMQAPPDRDNASASATKEIKAHKKLRVWETEGQ
jgi:hypothetical protein